MLFSHILIVCIMDKNDTVCFKKKQIKGMIFKGTSLKCSAYAFTSFPFSLANAVLKYPSSRSSFAPRLDRMKLLNDAQLIMQN